jgi:hypothetical protein
MAMKCLQTTLEKRQGDFVNLEIQVELLNKMLGSLDHPTYSHLMEQYHKMMKDPIFV